eukprot:GEMP01087923.1.p1 GENE.GEMP01087923.1~~GEMP01087923.1.p1  ORF type:complete len:258 (+),score=13.99 GEMP01087923.1:111-776(+)
MHRRTFGQTELTVDEAHDLAPDKPREGLFKAKNMFWLCAMWMSLLAGFGFGRTAEVAQTNDASRFEVPSSSSSEICAPTLQEAVRGYHESFIAGDTGKLLTYYSSDFQLHFRLSHFQHKVAILDGVPGFIAFSNWWTDHFDEVNFPSIDRWKISHVRVDQTMKMWTIDFEWHLPDGRSPSANEVHMFTAGNCIWRTYTRLTSDHEDLPPGQIVSSEPPPAI